MTALYLVGLLLCGPLDCEPAHLKRPVPQQQCEALRSALPGEYLDGKKVHRVVCIEQTPVVYPPARKPEFHS